jgi:O-antigen ligase
VTDRPFEGLLTRAAWLLLWLFVFSIPWEKSVAAPGLATLSHGIGILAFAAWGVAALRRGSVRPPNLALAIGICFVMWSWATWLWSVERAATVVRATTFAELLAMVWLIWDSCREEARLRGLMQAYVCGAVVAALNTYVRFLQGRQTYWRRYAAAGFDPNDCGLILALSVPLALYLSLHARSWRRAGYYAAILIVLSGVLLTASRTALVAALVALAFALWTWREADLPQRAATLVLPLVLVFGFYGLAPAPSRERLATLPAELTKGTLHNRTKIWKAGLKVLRHHPVLGIGVGAYPEAVKPQLGTPGVPGHEYVAHNTFLSVLVESGAVGFGLYASMLCVLAAFIWTMPSSDRALWTVMLLVWATGVSTLTWEQYKPSWLVVAWIMAAWSVSWRRRGSRM